MKVTFKELYNQLNESPIAGYGDWNPIKDRLLDKSLKQLKSSFDFVDTIKIGVFDLELHKMKDADIFVLGTKTENSFATVFNIELKRRTDIELVFPQYSNVVNVDGVIVEKSIRGFGIAKQMYQYFVNEMQYTILGDEIQYFGARLVWASLSKMDDVVVDVIDIQEEKVLKTDIILHHGEADYEFDETVYDYSDIKKNIRLVLTKVLSAD